MALLQYTVEMISVGLNTPRTLYDMATNQLLSGSNARRAHLRSILLEESVPQKGPAALGQCGWRVILENTPEPRLTTGTEAAEEVENELVLSLPSGLVHQAGPHDEHHQVPPPPGSLSLLSSVLISDVWERRHIMSDG